MTTTIGLIGAGAMGTALAASWRAGGSTVRTCLTGRSERTRALVRAAGLNTVMTIDDVVAADVVASVVPPRAAVNAAREIAAAARRRGSSPLVVDLNAVALGTLERIRAELDGPAGSFVDGSLSGPPPVPETTRTVVYLSGPHAEEVAAIPSPLTRTVVLGDEPGTASALKMCTASMYKGVNALVMQAVLTASHLGVLDAFLADVSSAWPDGATRWPPQVALAASKAERFADEMHEIAATQEQAGLTPALFEGVAEVYRRVAASDLGSAVPESVDPGISLPEMIRRLR